MITFRDLGFGSIYFHATRRYSVVPIKIEGLSVAKDARKVGRIWLCRWSSLEWVLQHLTGRDGSSAAMWSVLQVDLRGRQEIVKCSGREGIYYVCEDIEPGRVIHIADFWIDLTEDDLI